MGEASKLLKTLLSSALSVTVSTGPFRAGRDFRRATFQPEDLPNCSCNCIAAAWPKGSSSVPGSRRRHSPPRTNCSIPPRFWRNKLGFRGYLHLKVMPGSERAQVERAMQLADRVSINLEAPNTERLSKLAPHKVFMEELLQPLKWADEIRRAENPNNSWNGRWPPP